MSLTHKVMIRGEVQVQACERRWGNFCRSCEEAESQVQDARGVRLGLLGGCIEDARVECVFGRELDGPVVYESWSVRVVPNEEADEWSVPVPGYAGGAAAVAGLLARGGLPAEGPFEVSYYELGSGAAWSRVAPAGMEFRSHGGAQLDFAG